MEYNSSLLDNPVWNSLQTVHLDMRNGASNAVRYPGDILPFMALRNREGDLMQDILPYFDKKSGFLSLEINRFYPKTGQGFQIWNACKWSGHL